MQSSSSMPSPMPSLQLDHLVLTVADIKRSIDFYSSVLGFVPETDAAGRVSLHLKTMKINLHAVGAERKPHAMTPTPGSADLCFVSDMPLAEKLEHLAKQNITVIEGPIVRPGAVGSIESVYFRDPDGNLLEWGRPINLTS